MLLTVLLACVAAAVLLIGWARQPNMVMLYSGLTPEEAGKIVEKIRDAGVQYELKNGGTTVEVPEEKVYSLRLTMASQGLPSGDQSGYKILDEEKIGTSPFTQRVNYLRALQDELAKTIKLIEGVTYARVHVAKPESTIFGGKDKQSSATVVLRLKSGWKLTGSNVAAVLHLVAGSVEGLTPDRVVVVDNQGNLLSGAGQDELAKGTSTFLDYKTRVEQYLSRKAEDMLTAVLGPNRASVKVDAVIETGTNNQTTETYDPVKRVIAKESTKSKSATGGTGRPDNAQPAGGTKEETTESEYMVSVTKQQKMELPGQVKSLTVAAFVDLSAPPAAEGKSPAAQVQVKDVEEIIRNAIGLRTTDTLKVVNAPFHQQAAAQAAEPEEKGLFTKDFILEIAKRSSLGLLVIGVLVALKIFAGPKKKKAGAGGGTLALAAQTAGAGAENLLPASVGEVDPDMLRSRISRALQDNPEEVKRLFLSWVESEKGG